MTGFLTFIHFCDDFSCGPGVRLRLEGRIGGWRRSDEISLPFRRGRRYRQGNLGTTGPFPPGPMKEPVPHHAENRGLAPGPGNAFNLSTTI